MTPAVLLQLVAAWASAQGQQLSRAHAHLVREIASTALLLPASAFSVFARALCTSLEVRFELGDGSHVVTMYKGGDDASLLPFISLDVNGGSDRAHCVVGVEGGAGGVATVVHPDAVSKWLVGMEEDGEAAPGVEGGGSMVVDVDAAAAAAAAAEPAAAAADVAEPAVAAADVAEPAVAAADAATAPAPAAVYDQSVRDG